MTIHILGSSTTLASWERWAVIEKGLSPETMRAYSRELVALGPDLATYTTDDLRRRLHEAGGSPATVSRRIAAWGSFYKWLVRTDQRADDPTAKLDRPQVKRGLPRPVEDMAAVLDKLEPPFGTIALFLVSTGLRISEALAVNVTPPAPAELVVKGKGSKERVVPLTRAARTALDALGGHIGVSARLIQREFSKAGITPHRLRHTLATELARNDVDLSVIQDLLGHASPATTRVYQRNDVGRIREGLERRDLR